MKELKSKRIEEILIFFHVIRLEKWKNVGIEKKILVEKKNKRIDNVICMNLFLYSYYIIYKK